jgi:hypothetical protein
VSLHHQEWFWALPSPFYGRCLFGRDTVHPDLVGSIPTDRSRARSTASILGNGWFAAAQRDAEHAGRGMWSGSYVEPWLYRACIRQGGRPSECSDDASASSLAGRHFGFDSRCGGFLYSAFAETFRAFRGKDFTTRLRWLFDLLKPRANAGGANHLIQNFKRSFHRDQSLKQKLKSFARG